ncbi:MAG: hypothetical protein QXR45_13125 [Candidatus Bathyarchaeia archaeon]
MGRIILKRYDAAIGKITCIVRHGKDMMLLRKFSPEIKVQEIKEYALKS